MKIQISSALILAVTAWASISSADLAKNEKGIVCNVSYSEQYCFMKAEVDGQAGTAVCELVGRSCPGKEACLSDPTDAGAQVKRLSSYSGDNSEACNSFKVENEPAPRPGGLGNGGGR